jgi:predicted metal-dependent HD superfamily phosphohydrolase
MSLHLVSSQCNKKFEATEFELLSLQARWNTVVCPCFRKDASSWWNQIVTLHQTSTDRHYHTMMHLYEMMEYADHLQQSNDPVVVLSIFFHDAIYDPRSNRNEEASAELFQKFYVEHQSLDDTLGPNVVRYIRCTQHHRPPKNNKDQALEFFLDMDMAVLAKDEEAYLHYASLIRKEYAWVERTVYCEKRAEVLSNFRMERHLYCTQLFRDNLESQARKNLELEIRLLNEGCIPGESFST